jgi:hypothetical protein
MTTTELARMFRVVGACTDVKDSDCRAVAVRLCELLTRRRLSVSAGEVALLAALDKRGIPWKASCDGRAEYFL